MARQRLTYKTYPVSTRVDPRGVFYGLIQGATTEPESSLREIMAYKKITAFDPKQVVNLVEDIIQGGMELTALDGRPRAISSMIKTFLGFDGSFPTEDARVTTQQLVSRVRLLKDMRVAVDMDNFTLVNEREAQLPFVVSSCIDAGASPSVTGNVLYMPILTFAAPDTSYYISHLRLTGRRLDEPSAWSLSFTNRSGVLTTRNVTTKATAQGEIPYSTPHDGEPETFIGFYSACLQVEWTPTGVAYDPNPNDILPAIGSTVTLRAQSPEGGLLYELPLTLVARPV